MYSVINLLDTVNAICFLISSNPPVPCPAGMYSLGGRFENCTVCPAGNACPDPAGAPVACTGGKHPFDSHSNGCCSQLLSQIFLFLRVKASTEGLLSMTPITPEHSWWVLGVTTQVVCY